jgi:uncharacterized FAD-dependent dehydrogenase|tara:strand:- start:70 stop:285 length:216 start_codon:yes stop_codon:yes gene_type:complete
MTSKTQMTKKQLIEALSSAEQKIAELEEQVDILEKEKVHIGAKLLDDEQSNMVNILKSKIEDLEGKQKIDD